MKDIPWKSAPAPPIPEQLLLFHRMNYRCKRLLKPECLTFCQSGRWALMFVVISCFHSKLLFNLSKVDCGYAMFSQEETLWF